MKVFKYQEKKVFTLKESKKKKKVAASADCQEVTAKNSSGNRGTNEQYYYNFHIPLHSRMKPNMAAEADGNNKR